MRFGGGQGIASEWWRKDLDYDARVDRLLTAGLNTETVLGDQARDDLDGGPGLDWLLAEAFDKLKLESGEVLTALAG